VEKEMSKKKINKLKIDQKAKLPILRLVRQTKTTISYLSYSLDS
jgi:hypothetical protein